MQTNQHEAELKIRWLPLPKAIGWLAACVVAIGLMSVYIDPVFAFLTRTGEHYAGIGITGCCA